VNFGQLETGHVPQPKTKRQLGVGRVFRQASRRVEERFLEHIRVIHAALQQAAQAYVHHPFEPIAMPRKHLVGHLFVAAGRPLQEVF
jgi:hypothetical protein